jgi:hypothetical protein
MLKVMVAPAIMVVLIVLVACGGPAETLAPAAAVPTDTPDAIGGPRPTLAPRQLQVLLEGEGPEVLGPYEMLAGVIIAFVRYEGETPFSLTFIDEEQRLVRSVESRPGPYNGERVHSVFEGNPAGLKPGVYTVSVEATGPWQARLFQESIVRGQEPEITMEGTGDGGGGWVDLSEGEYTMTTTYDGSAELSVDLFDSVGASPYRIIRTTGNDEVQEGFTVGGGEPGENPQPGIYAIGVRSQGSWSVNITNDDAE